MMNIKFEENEYLVMAMFERKSRKMSIQEIKEALKYLDKNDEELISLVEQTIYKMERISDSAYSNMNLEPYRQEVEDEENED